MASDVALRLGGGAIDALEAIGICHARLGRRRDAKLVSDTVLVWATMVVWIAACFAVAMLIRMVDGGPALFRQQRIGLNGQPFVIRKFRTMTGTGEATTALADERVTGLGRMLRRFHVDEWPQLWNVAWGEMSLVGPRPEQPCLVRVYANHLPGYDLRHLLRPGITGLAQVSAPYAGNLDETRVKLAHDLDYLRRGGAAMDAWILAVTPWVIWKRRGR